MAWGWRKILQLRPLIRPFIYYRLGAGIKASLWFDRWSSLSPLSQIVTVRDIHRAGFKLFHSVKDGILNGNWAWPVDWYVKYPLLNMCTVPSLIPNTLDRLIWMSHNGVDNDFSVSIAWDSIRPRGDVNWYNLVWFSHAIPRHAFHLWLVIKRKLKTQDTLRQWDVSSNANLNLLQCPLCGLQPDSHNHLFFECDFSFQVWDHLKTYAGLPNSSASLDSIVDMLIPISKKKSLEVTYLAHSFISLMDLALLDCYSFSGSLARASLDALKSECRLRSVLFFPSPRFFPLGFSWEGVLRRRSWLAFYTPMLLKKEDFESLCTFKWFFPIGVIVSVFW
ncbi:reverse transcriptase domain, reverse transcriptase zinc-binding domain protein [Tanacetum coccineum]